MLTLEVTSGPATGQSVELGEELVIGREDAGLAIDDPEISRRHARVSPVDGGVMVEDLGSTNGTFVNGERAEAPVTLKESAMIRVGTTEIAVNIPIAPVPDATRVRNISDFDPDVTRAREIPDFDPDVTRARPIATDVTAPRAVAPPQPGQAPSPPPAGGPPPPAAGPPPPAAPGPPPPAAPGPPPPAAAPPAAASPAKSGPPPVVIAIVVGVVVAIVVLVVLLVL